MRHSAPVHVSEEGEVSYCIDQPIGYRAVHHISGIVMCDRNPPNKRGVPQEQNKTLLNKGAAGKQSRKKWTIKEGIETNKNTSNSTYQEKIREESERGPCPGKETTRNRREEEQKEGGRTRARPQGGNKREIRGITTRQFEDTRTARAEEAKFASRKKEEGHEGKIKERKNTHRNTPEGYEGKIIEIKKVSTRSQ